MKIFTLKPRENWCVDRLVEEWTSGNTDICTDDLRQADVVWLCADWAFDQIPIELFEHKKVVTTIHHITSPEFFKAPAGWQNVKEKFFGTIEEHRFKIRDALTHVYHVPCSKTKEQVEYIRNKLGLKHPKPVEVIPFWVNDKLWRNLNNTQAFRFKWGLNSTAQFCLIGSFQRDSEGADLSPKLEKGADIFCDVLEMLNQRPDGLKPFAVLTGWRRDYIERRLTSAKIGFKHPTKRGQPNDLISFEDVNELYNCLDFYFVSSRIEGGPLAISECAAAQVPIISHDVGMAKDILHPDVVFSGGQIPDNIVERAMSQDVIDYNYKKISPHMISNGGFKPFRSLFETL